MARNSQRPTTAQQRIIAEEERLAATVREALAAARAGQAHRAGLRQDLWHLRDEAQQAGEADQAGYAQQWHTLRSQAEALPPEPALPDADAPYFAHLRLRVHGRQRDVLLGDHTLLDPGRGVTVVDWRRGPMARVFFRYAAGEDYEEEHEGRTLEGHVLARRVLAFRRGTLCRIEDGGRALWRDDGGPWRQVPAVAPPRLGAPERRAGPAFGTGSTGIARPPITALLDPAQHRVIERTEQRALLILGSAGSGKTTVALHRADALLAHRPQAVRPTSCLAVAPTPGLVRLLRHLLDHRGLPDLPAVELDPWLVRHARRVVPGLPRRLAEDTPAAVIRFKRHPALQAVLPGWVERLGRDIAQDQDRLHLAHGELLRALEAQPKGGLLFRLTAAARTAQRQTPSLALSPAAVVERAQERLGSTWDLLLELLGDRETLGRAVDASGGALSLAHLEEVVRRATRQAAPGAAQRFAHVAASRRIGVDGRGVDEGTPDMLGGAADVEDHALALELHALVHGGAELRPAGALDHLLIDELQEVAPIELTWLGAQRRPKGWLTAAGDHAQQLDPGTAWQSWQASMAALGAGDHHRARLEVGYRCTREIITFAQAVLGDPQRGAPPVMDRRGGPVLRSAVAGPGERTLLLEQGLGPLLDREPAARVALLAATDDDAEELHRELAAALPCRRVVDGDFSFAPGVEVASVGQVPGLEFDYVILPDVDAGRYPDTPQARRRLYVAATRALHQLWILWDGEPSPLLPHAPR